MANNTEHRRKHSALRQTATITLSCSPLADQDEGSLVGNIYVYAMWIHPVNGFRHSVYLVSGPWIPMSP